MKEVFTREKIGEEIYFSTVETDKFTTSRISVNLIVDPTRETVTANALVAFLLRKGCEMYPDFTALNLRLDELYGAAISTDVKRFGDKQIINVTGTCINDKYALEGESVLLELAKLICDVITNPVMKNGLFLQKEIDLEKNVLADTIRSVRDDKGAYIMEKLISNMCAEEPFGLKKYGYCEDMYMLTAEYVTACYKDILSNSRVEVFCTGEGIEKEIKEVFINTFANISRKVSFDLRSCTTKPLDAPIEIVEKLNITQSKVALGFATDIAQNDKAGMALRLMNAIYGGNVPSKLFTNVRERLGLCYYCASTVEKFKGLLIAYSGVEEKNRQKTIEEMLSQLEDIKNGNVSEEELKQAKAAITTSLELVGDSLYGLESWYFGQIVSEAFSTPEEEKEAYEKLTVQDVVDVSKSVKLNMIYSIVEGGDEE